MELINLIFKKALPVLCGFLLISIETLLLCSFITPFIPLVLSFLIGVLLGTFICLTKKDFIGNSYITLVVTTLPTLGCIGLFAFYPENKLSYILVLFILMNWFSVNLPCYIARIFSPKTDANNFKTYSKQVSLLFIFSYVILLGFLLFSSAFDDRVGFRSINLIPLRTIIHYITGNTRVSLRIIAVNLLGNILLFVPLGFYLKAFIKVGWRTLLAILGIPLLIELTQYIFAVGVSDIDDVILNVFGALTGYLLFLLLDLIYLKFNKNPNSNFLGF